MFLMLDTPTVLKKLEEKKVNQVKANDPSP